MERLQDESSSATAGTPTGPPLVPRSVYINGRHRFCSNKISTAKYNVFSFIPKFLFEQFRRYSNIFFLFIAVMQQIPGVSPTGRYTTAVPLVFILVVSALKEMFEDIKRHSADTSVNRSRALVLNRITRTWESKHWFEVGVGDVVKVVNNHFFPSDLLLLSSSEPNGMCYIETANLDGETNLKIRQSLTATFECVTSEKLVSDLTLASIECDPPNKHLYEFHGTLKIGDRIYPVTPNQILLRGAKLKNSTWIFGCVLYTGHETKLMMNSMLQSPLKQSRVEKLTNSHILSLFAILAVIAAISTVANILWNYENQHWYLHGLEDLSSNPLFTFLTFIILYNNLIPISLQVTLEVVRFLQAHFINSDIEMYDEASDTPAMARTSNLNEELGQVKYILSDKTGTLTCNVMEFKQCSVAGTIYTERDMDRLVDVAKLEQKEQKTEQKEQKTEQKMAREFLTLLSVCHTVVPELSSDPNDEIRYQAASPDEGALVKGAARLGFRFTTRTPEYAFIDALGKEERFEVLNVLEFTSERKRMSVIVRCPDGSIKILLKGADSVVQDRLSPKGDQWMETTLTHLEHFASLGLRTLCLAFAVIPEEEYELWNKSYIDAITADPEIREGRVESVMDGIERNLTLIGATAVEDRLQDGVPESIEILLKAGIRVWVLTGDKKETAINIGFSCRLLTQEMNLMILSESSLDATREAMNDLEPDPKAALVVDGSTLRYALGSDLKSDFMQIALTCRCVICCRVSPIQKAEVVELVKLMTRQVTLAIGDGANDVAMIRAANVGVGISGQEGLQAAHSADYSISQFRFLTRLLLVHGSWSLYRLCKLILYSFYKNIALYVIELWFASVSGWSGQTIFERWTIGMYNVIFTAAPPLAIGLFDRQVSADTMIKYPSLYSSQGDPFSPRLFWIWVSSALLHSLALFWLTHFMVSNDSLWSSGLSDGGYLVFGNILYTYVVVTVSIKSGLEITSWTWLTHLAIWGSIALWFLFLVVYSNVWPALPLAPDMVSMDRMIFSSRVFWAGLFLIPFLTLIVDISYKVVSRTCFKSLADEITDLELRSVASSPSQQTLLSETARLIRNVFDSTRRKKRGRSEGKEGERGRPSDLELRFGYAFSQEEHGVVPQSQLIRAYDTTKAKPSGV